MQRCHEENILPGQKWEMAIDQTIKKADYFIARLSSNSVAKKGYVQKEIRRALDILDTMPEKDIFIIPVRLDDCQPDHPRIETLQWVDMFYDVNEMRWRKGYSMVKMAIEERQRSASGKH